MLNQKDSYGTNTHGQRTLECAACSNVFIMNGIGGNPDSCAKNKYNE